MTKPPAQNDPRGGRLISTSTFVTALRDSLGSVLVTNREFTSFVGKLTEHLQPLLSQPTNTIRVGDLLYAIRDCARAELGPVTAAGLDLAIRKLVRDFAPTLTPAVVSNGTGQTNTYSQNDLVVLAQLLKGLNN